MADAPEDLVPSPWSASYSLGRYSTAFRFKGRTTRTGLLLLALGLPLMMLPGTYWTIGGALAIVGASAVLWDRRTFGRWHARLALLSVGIYLPVAAYMAGLWTLFGASAYVHSVVPTYSTLNTPWAPQNCAADWLSRINAQGPYSYGDAVGGLFGHLALLNSILGLSFMFLGFQLLGRRGRVAALGLLGFTVLVNLGAMMVIYRNLAYVDAATTMSAREVVLDRLVYDWRILSSMASPLWAVLYLHAAKRIDVDLIALRAPAPSFRWRRLRVALPSPVPTPSLPLNFPRRTPLPNARAR